jgi:hypothetical protein
MLEGGFQMIQVKDKQYYLENVCTNCPGTLRGQTTICKMHSLHIGKVESCPEWDHHDSPTLKDHDGQLAFLDLEPAIEVVQKVEEDLRNYKWMPKRIKELRKGLEDAGEGLVRQYGLESSMPKPQGNISDPINREVQLRMRDWDRLKKLESKIANIDHYVDNLSNERDREIIHCILDGWKYKDIACHVGISRTTIDEIKKALVKDMAWKIYGEELKGEMHE